MKPIPCNIILVEIITLLFYFQITPIRTLSEESFLLAERSFVQEEELSLEWATLGELSLGEETFRIEHDQTETKVQNENDKIFCLDDERPSLESCESPLQSEVAICAFYLADCSEGTNLGMCRSRVLSPCQACADKRTIFFKYGDCGNEYESGLSSIANNAKALNISVLAYHPYVPIDPSGAQGSPEIQRALDFGVNSVIDEMGSYTYDKLESVEEEVLGSEINYRFTVVLANDSYLVGSKFTVLFKPKYKEVSLTDSKILWTRSKPPETLKEEKIIPVEDVRVVIAKQLWPRLADLAYTMGYSACIFDNENVEIGNMLPDRPSSLEPEVFIDKSTVIMQVKLCYLLDQNHVPVSKFCIGFIFPCVIAYPFKIKFSDWSTNIGNLTLGDIVTSGEILKSSTLYEFDNLAGTSDYHGTVGGEIAVTNTINTYNLNTYKVTHSIEVGVGVTWQLVKDILGSQFTFKYGHTWGSDTQTGTVEASGETITLKQSADVVVPPGETKHFLQEIKALRFAISTSSLDIEASSTIQFEGGLRPDNYYLKYNPEFASNNWLFYQSTTFGESLVPFYRDLRDQYNSIIATDWDWTRLVNDHPEMKTQIEELYTLKRFYTADQAFLADGLKGTKLEIIALN